MTSAVGEERSRGERHMVPWGRREHHVGCLTQGLRSLLVLVTEEADTAALAELLEGRPVFRLRGGRPLLLPQVLSHLRERLATSSHPHALDLADWAYDRTLDKFSNLPASEEQAGPDCRNYYGGVLSLVDRWKQEHPGAGPLEEEGKTAEILQRMVIKHFHLSKLDYYRRPGAGTRRYTWRVKDARMNLWCPAQISGRQLRTWLEETFPDPDPDAPGEQNRIQDAIDRTFVSPSSISWEGSEVGATYRANARSPFASLVQKEETAEATARVGLLVNLVAEEKVQHIDEQRPAIRRLGRERLRQLIERVFRDVAGGAYKDHAIGRDFGLSKATFSRFAGSRWSESLQSAGQPTIPDLWRNLARIMANDPEFLAAAAHAGVLPNLSRTVAAMGDRLQESEDDS